MTMAATPLARPIGAMTHSQPPISATTSTIATRIVGSIGIRHPKSCTNGNNPWATARPCGVENGLSIDGTGYISEQLVISATPMLLNETPNARQMNVTPRSRPSAVRQSPVNTKQARPSTTIYITLMDANTRMRDRRSSQPRTPASTSIVKPRPSYARPLPSVICIIHPPQIRPCQITIVTPRDWSANNATNRTGITNSRI